MEYIIGGIILAVALAIVRNNNARKPRQNHTETDEERKRREADEIVTVILPTINHDK